MASRAPGSLSLSLSPQRPSFEFVGEHLANMRNAAGWARNCRSSDLFFRHAKITASMSSQREIKESKKNEWDDSDRCTLNHTDHFGELLSLDLSSLALMFLFFFGPRGAMSWYFSYTHESNNNNNLIQYNYYNMLVGRHVLWPAAP